MRRLLAVFLIGSGVALAAVPFGMQLWSSQRTDQAQERLVRELPPGPARERAGGIPAARPVAVGQALMVMRIPRFGADWEWVVSEGTAPQILVDGPGHYPATALPGERGNAAFAAHRAGHGDPFIDFDLLRPGDRVVLEQGRVRWVYRIDTQPRIIPVTAAWVLSPTAGRRLTLTTCWPRYGSSKRMFVRAQLEGTGPAGEV